MTKIVVIYHRADFDGLFCREIARRRLDNGWENVEYIGWDYGDAVPVIAPEVALIYMLDISIDALMGDTRLAWIDHHASAIAKYPSTIPGYRIDGVAACRLAWQWFFNNIELPSSKACFYDRAVPEPYAVQLAGEYDIWDKRNPDADTFQHALRAQELGEDIWRALLNIEINETLQVQESQIMVQTLMPKGRAVEYTQRQQNESIITAYGFTRQFEGLTFLCCNHARFNSHLFAAGIKPEHEGLLGFNWTGKEWRISLYGVPGKPEVDLAAIAVKYGGGGHKQACGFRLATLPFLTEETRQERAMAAYTRYGKVTEFKNFRGEPMPQWHELPPKIREAWEAAAN